MTLPSLGAGAEEQERLLRRLHHNARVREKASKIEAHNSVHRSRALDDMRLETRMAKEEMRASHMERVMRWTQKTQSSPLGVDLWAEDEMKFKQARAREAAEKRK